MVKIDRVSYYIDIRSLLLNMVVFNLAIFATFDNNSYSVQVPKTPQKEGIRA